MSDPAADDPPPPDLTARTVGEFQVLRKLGQGGMGQVYLARQLSLKRDVALKILRDDHASNPTALKRFQAEAEAVARVTHANIVQVYAVGEHDGLRYMALEFVDGRNLRDYLARKGPPELPLAVSIIRQVAAALQRAGEGGLVHRDIKPENILITRKAEVKVTDFGLSRYFAPDAQPLHLTQSGMTLGTPLYMSPEQVQGQPVDHRSDIYSLGVTCYHLLAGQPPFRGATAFEVAVQHVQAEPPPLSAVRPDLPADLCGMVHRMLAKKPEDRYQTAREVIRDLARVQKGLAVAAPAASGSAPVLVAGSGLGSQVPLAPMPPLPPSAAGGRFARRVSAAVLLLGLAAAGWLGYGAAHAPADADPADPGLPAARPPQPVVSARERALLAVVQNRAAKPAEVVDAAAELGLLYVAERRLDEADRVFAELEQERFDGRPAKAAVGPAGLAGRLGKVVVLAHRDQAQESNDRLEQLLSGPPKLPPAVLEKFLLAHPGFARSLAESLTRNADNLNQPRLPDRLDWLRTPGGLVRGKG